MKTFAPKTVLLSTLLCVSVAGALPGAAWAQSSSLVAPTLIPVSGRLVTAAGQAQAGAQAQAGTVDLTISLYDGQGDASPRWIEQQLSVPLDPSGAYSIQFGATLPDGLPGDLFTDGAGTRWLGIAVNGVEQPRVMLLSVPYAAKAASAETLGGKTASDFVLSSTFREDLRTVLEEEGVTGGGDDVSVQATPGRIAKFDGSGNPTADSVAFDNGTGIGIGTTSPVTRLDVVGDTTNSSIKAGGLELQSYNTNNNWLADNLYFNGGFRYRASGTGSQVYFDNGEISFLTAPAGVAGAVAQRQTRMRLLGNGRVGIGAHTPATLLDIAGDPTNSSLKAGSLEVQSYNTNNTWLADNMYYSAGFKYRTAGTASQVYFDNGDIVFYTAPAGAAGATVGRSSRLAILNNGNIGIGTSAPTSKLHVVGATRITGDIVVDGNIAAKYQDVAEWVDAAEPLEAGTVVIVDVTASNRVRASTKSYDSRVAGAVSPQPGLILGEAGEGKVLVAQSGRVRIKADTRNGAIKPGDLLVTSPRAGYAMKAKSAKPGTVLGKALEPLDKGTGDILVLLTLQ